MFGSSGFGGFGQQNNQQQQQQQPQQPAGGLFGQPQQPTTPAQTGFGTSTGKFECTLTSCDRSGMLTILSITLFFLQRLRIYRWFRCGSTRCADGRRPLRTTTIPDTDPIVRRLWCVQQQCFHNRRFRRASRSFHRLWWLRSACEQHIIQLLHLWLHSEPAAAAATSYGRLWFIHVRFCGPRDRGPLWTTAAAATTCCRRIRREHGRLWSACSRCCPWPNHPRYCNRSLRSAS